MIWVGNFDKVELLYSAEVVGVAGEKRKLVRDCSCRDECVICASGGFAAIGAKSSGDSAEGAGRGRVEVDGLEICFSELAYPLRLGGRYEGAPRTIPPG
jgi:hypothetical protein